MKAPNKAKSPLIRVGFWLYGPVGRPPEQGNPCESSTAKPGIKNATCVAFFRLSPPSSAKGVSANEASLSKRLCHHKPVAAAKLTAANSLVLSGLNNPELCEGGKRKRSNPVITSLSKPPNSPQPTVWRWPV
jgi:hypothetical protein